MWGLWLLCFNYRPQILSHFWKALTFSLHLLWKSAFETGFGCVARDHAIRHQIQQGSQRKAALYFASFWNTVFLYFVILSYCHCFVFESFKHYSDDCHWPPPPPHTHKVNVLKKTLPKMLYCWMSQVMIYCRSYVLWNHSQETCVNTSSM